MTKLAYNLHRLFALLFLLLELFAGADYYWISASLATASPRSSGSFNSGDGGLWKLLRPTRQDMREHKQKGNRAKES